MRDSGTFRRASPTTGDAAGEPGRFGRRLFASGMWAAAGRGIVATGTLLNTALIARLLPQSEFAAYLLIASLSTLLSLCVCCGLPATVLRHMRVLQAEGRERQIGVLVGRTAFWPLVGLLPLGLATNWLRTAPGAGGLTAMLQAHAVTILLLTALQAFSLLAGEIHRGYQNFRQAAFIGGLGGGCLPVGLQSLCLMTAQPGSLGEVLLWQAAAAAIPLTGALAALWPRLAGSPDGPGPMAEGEAGDLPPGDVSRLAALAAPGCGTLLREALPLLVTQLFTAFLTQADLWFVAAYAGDSDVAVYGGVRRLLTFVTAPLLLINVALPTFITDLHVQNRRRELEDLLRWTATVASVPATLALLALLAAPGTLLSLIYGAEYAEGARALVILSLANLVFVYSGSCGLALNMTGHNWELMLLNLASATCYFLIAPWLTSRYGTSGAAFAAGSLIAAQNVAAVIALRLRVGLLCCVSFSPRLFARGIRQICRA